jgi:hypothetical protein
LTPPLTDAERGAQALTDRCEYGPLGNRRTCGCLHCAAWRSRLRQRQARAAPQPRISTPARIPHAVKASIVDQMFLAGPRQLAQTARTLGAQFDVSPLTITTRWRHWAAARDPV